jgi:hypothetical protein
MWKVARCLDPLSENCTASVSAGQALLTQITGIPSLEPICVGYVTATGSRRCRVAPAPSLAPPPSWSHSANSAADHGTTEATADCYPSGAIAYIASRKAPLKPTPRKRRAGPWAREYRLIESSPGMRPISFKCCSKASDSH